nr:unnamed protein product [Spirometra erinaceieuropaei]
MGDTWIAKKQNNASVLQDNTNQAPTPINFPLPGAKCVYVPSYSYSSSLSPSSSSTAPATLALAAVTHINSSHNPGQETTPTLQLPTPEVGSRTTPALTATAPSPHTSAWSVTCESIAQKLANQCLVHQPTPIAFAFTASTAHESSRIAWASSATCASTSTCGGQPPAALRHQSLIPRITTSPHINTLPPQASNCHLACKYKVCISTRPPPCGLCYTGGLSPRLFRHVKRRG